MASFFAHETACVDEGASVGEGTAIWHFCHIQSGARIGRDCVLGQNVNVGPGAVVGNAVRIQNNVSVYEGVELADYVFCGPSCVFTNDMAPRSKYPKDPMRRGVGRVRTFVGEGASLGANATIVCGHVIGEWALVGAGSVVTRDVPAHALVVGVPDLQVGWVCECGETLGESLRCDACGRAYAASDAGLQEVAP